MIWRYCTYEGVPALLAGIEVIHALLIPDHALLPFLEGEKDAELAAPILAA